MTNTIAEAIGPSMQQVAQAARLIQRDAETVIHKPCSAFELSTELEETRERCSIAFALLEQVLEDFDSRHGTGAYTRSPIERAEAALRAGGAA
jgi:hypothetical protein